MGIVRPHPYAVAPVEMESEGLRRFAALVASSRPSAQHRRHVAYALLGVVLLVALNVAVFVAPIDYTGFASFAYAGAFIVCLFANALVAVPIPYIPIVANIGASAGSPFLVVLVAALGSVLGESVAFLVGRAEEGLVSEHPMYGRFHRLAERPLLMGGLLFLLAVPLNPLFDVAGLIAGAVGMRYRLFFVSVFTARLVRLALIVWLGTVIGFASAPH